jgi:hypothetical protein
VTAVSSFDPDSGRLALTPGALNALRLAGASGLEALPSELREEISAGSLAVDNDIHPRLVPPARCLARPHVRLVLDQTGSDHQLRGWIDEQIAVLTRPSISNPAMPAEVVVVPRGMVPLRLAKLIALGPRRRVKLNEPAEVDRSLLETLLSGEQSLSVAQVEGLSSDTDELIPEWAEALAALSAGKSTRWLVGVWWNAPGESPKARSLEVVEGEVGSFLISDVTRGDGTHRRVRLRPLSASAIWRLLCGLVPSQDEIAEPFSIE